MSRLTWFNNKMLALYNFENLDIWEFHFKRPSNKKIQKVTVTQKHDWKRRSAWRNQSVFLINTRSTRGHFRGSEIDFACTFPTAHDSNTRHDLPPLRIRRDITDSIYFGMFFSRYDLFHITYFREYRVEFRVRKNYSCQMKTISEGSWSISARKCSIPRAYFLGFSLSL